MPATPVLPYLLPILMLLASNVFMTCAWYGHLKYKDSPLFLVILVAWGIAFVEYCLAVPANRWGSAVYTTAQLKTMQEVITLLEHDPEKWEPVSRLREVRFCGRRKVGKDHAQTRS